MCVEQRVFCRKYYYYVTWQCSHLLLSAVLRLRCSRAPGGHRCRSIRRSAANPPHAARSSSWGRMMGQTDRRTGSTVSLTLLCTLCEQYVQLDCSTDNNRPHRCCHFILCIHSCSLVVLLCPRPRGGAFRNRAIRPFVCPVAQLPRL